MFKVYWTQSDGSPSSMNFFPTELKAALEYTQYLRKEGRRFVTLVSENENMIGQLGATSPDSSYVPQMLN
jgi:hypothetical protein